jgi:hypothetical protein
MISWPFVLFIAAILLARFIPFSHQLGDFAPQTDDWSLIFFSSRLEQWQEWWTIGFRDYFANYPDYNAAGPAFIRPITNVTFWLGGLLEGAFGWQIHIAISYLILLLTYISFAILLTQRSLAFDWTKACALALFMFSPVWDTSFFVAAFRTDVLATLFFFICLIIQERYHPSLGRTLLLASLAMASAWSHDIGIFAVGALVVYVTVATGYEKGIGRDVVRASVPYVGALLVVILLRLLLVQSPYQRLGGRFEAAQVIEVGAELVKFMLMAGYPTSLATFRNIFPLHFSATELKPLLGIVTSTVILFLAINSVRGPARPENGHKLALLTAYISFTVPVALLSANEDRHFMISLGLILLAAFNSAVHVRSRISAAFSRMTPLLAAASVALASSHAIASTDERQIRNEKTRALWNLAVEALKDPTTKSIVLVNDTVGRHGARSLLRLATERVARPDVSVRTANVLVGPQDLDAIFRVWKSDKKIFVHTELTAAQRFDFPGMNPPWSIESRSSDGIKYDLIVNREEKTADRLAARLGFSSSRRHVDYGRRLTLTIDDHNSGVRIIAFSPLERQPRLY